MPSEFEQIESLKQLAQDAYDENRMACVVELLPCYLEHFPTDSKAWFNYGDSLRVLGRAGAAAVALGKAERMCPPEHVWAVQSRLGLLFQDRGDHSTAERWHVRALESSEAQQESWVWILRGVNFAMQELFDEAESCYRSAIAVNDRDEEAYLNLGCILRATCRYEAAAKAATMALTLCPEYPKAKALLDSLQGAIAARELANKLC